MFPRCTAVALYHCRTVVIIFIWAHSAVSLSLVNSCQLAVITREILSLETQRRDVTSGQKGRKCSDNPTLTIVSEVMIITVSRQGSFCMVGRGAADQVRDVSVFNQCS